MKISMNEEKKIVSNTINYTFNYTKEKKEQNILKLLKNYFAPLITLFSIISYFLVYLYERIYTSYFNVSSDYIEIDIYGFFYKISPILIILFILVALRITLLDSNQDFNKEKLFSIYWSIFLFTLNSVTLLISILKGYYSVLSIAILVINYIIICLYYQEITKKEDSKGNNKNKNGWILFIITWVCLAVIIVILKVTIKDYYYYYLNILIMLLIFILLFIICFIEYFYRELIRYFEVKVGLIGAIFLFFIITAFVYQNISYFVVVSKLPERYVVYQENDNRINQKMKTDNVFMDSNKNKYYLFYVIYENKDYLCLKPIEYKNGKICNLLPDQNNQHNDYPINSNITYTVSKSKIDIIHIFSSHDYLERSFPEEVEISLRNDDLFIPNEKVDSYNTVSLKNVKCSIDKNNKMTLDGEYKKYICIEPDKKRWKIDNKKEVKDNEKRKKKFDITKNTRFCKISNDKSPSFFYTPETFMEKLKKWGEDCGLCIIVKENVVIEVYVYS